MANKMLQCHPISSSVKPVSSPLQGLSLPKQLKPGSKQKTLLDSLFLPMAMQGTGAVGMR